MMFFGKETIYLYNLQCVCVTDGCACSVCVWGRRWEFWRFSHSPASLLQPVFIRVKTGGASLTCVAL